MKLKIETTITVDDNINGDQIEQIRHEFEDVAWENNFDVYQPSIKIQEL